jgi:glutathione synthase
MASRPAPADLEHFLILASSYGLLMSQSPPLSHTHIPFSLLPTAFPKAHFQDLIASTPLHTQLMFSVSKNVEYLKSRLQTVSEADVFTKRLLEISEKVHNGRFFQDITLGLTRNDFMFDTVDENFLQVEFNTISVSFAALGSKIVDFHRHVLGLLNQTQGSAVLENQAVENFGHAFKLAYDLYGGTGSVLFVVEPKEKNIFDQTAIEIELWHKW